ncbi:hypothetical protein E1B28_003080 [Marasmius oreades]|uniref:DUF6534 domain-containing protein n=1 Tax=Marasmius oreades TaxID=181124 RepID=A0A9P7UK90_9AGAR|nr:uncharacterized protein E1B28_003080 [Marasmius oreades]KAG7085520.1 hypothetical protein E1B28_003080 [Marasmius oreades]
MLFLTYHTSTSSRCFERELKFFSIIQGWISHNTPQGIVAGREVLCNFVTMLMSSEIYVGKTVLHSFKNLSISQNICCLAILFLLPPQRFVRTTASRSKAKTAKMTTPCAPIAFPPLHDTFGCLFIGTTLSGAMWGVTTMQTYNYFLEYFGVDRPLLSIMVGVVYALDTVHQMMLLHLVYTYLVSNFGNPVILGTLVWSILIMVLLTAMIGLICQLFLTYRVWVLSRGKIHVVVIVLLPILGLFSTTLAYFAKAWPFTTFAQLALVGGFSKAVNVLGAVSDITITIALSILLWSSKSGMRKTDAIVNRLILFCVRTGAITTLCAICSLITISALPNTFIYITFYCTLARWYTASLLATLNARSDLRSQTNAASHHSLANVSLDHHTGSRERNHGRPGDADVNVRRIAINKDVETLITNEYEMKTQQAL